MMDKIPLKMTTKTTVFRIFYVKDFDTPITLYMFVCSIALKHNN